jgi:hypothetical protein
VPARRRRFYFDQQGIQKYTVFMDAQLPSSDFEAFYAFLGDMRLTKGAAISPEESVQQFRESQNKYRRFQELNNVALIQSRQGLSKPLDLETLLERVEQRVAQGHLTDG